MLASDQFQPADPWDIAATIMDPASDPGIVEWRSVARPKQLPPPGEWFVWLLMAGRGFGKTRTGAEWINERARRCAPGDQVLIAGRTPADVRDYALNGPGGLLTHHPDIRYEPSNRKLRWPNGVEGLIRSGANPDEFRGYSGEIVWLDEFAAWSYPQECWDNLIFGTREGDPRITITTTPRPIQVLREIIEDPATVVVRGTSDENRENLSDKWFDIVVEALRGTRLGRQEINAELLEDIEGALWKRDLVEGCRVRSGELPALRRIVVAVDPQGKKGAKSEGRETGIVVVALGVDGHVYVLHDGSLNGTSSEWGTRAVALYHKFDADRIVGEVNFGGDMVESTIRAVKDDEGKRVAYKEVRASRGKQRRAEPVAALYEKGKAHHVGGFPALEDEMCTWTDDETWSPNRMDALVWGATEVALDRVIPSKRRTLRSYPSGG